MGARGKGFLSCATLGQMTPSVAFAVRNRQRLTWQSVLVAQLRRLRWFPLANGKICRRQINLINNNLHSIQQKSPRLQQGEKGLCVFGGDLRDLLGGYAVKLCQHLGNVREHSRMAHLAAMGDGRHIRAIGFNKQPFKRD